MWLLGLLVVQVCGCLGFWVCLFLLVLGSGHLGFALWVFGVGLWSLGFWLWVCGCGFPGVGLLGFGFGALGFELGGWVLCLGILSCLVLGVGLWIWFLRSGFCVFEFWVSDFELWVWGLGFGL